MLDSKKRKQDLNWALSFLRKAQAHATADQAAMLVAGGAVALVLCFAGLWPFIAVAGPMLIVGAMLTAGASVKGWKRWRRRRKLKIARERRRPVRGGPPPTATRALTD